MDLRKQINDLQARSDRQTALRQKFESREAETLESLRKILDAVSSKPQPEAQKLPRFAPPRSLTTPKRPPGRLSVHMSQLWERLDRETAEATAIRGAPVMVTRGPAPPSQARAAKRGPQMTTPKPTDQVFQKKAAIESPALPPAAKPPEQPPKPARVPAINEPSFFIDDYSKLDDMRAFFDRIGLRAAIE
jgi:hypothetical protein